MCRRRGRGRRRVDGVLAQAQHDQALAAVNERRQPEDAGVAERFVERAAKEIHRRHARRPDDVVDADVSREDVIAHAVANQGFQRGQVKHTAAASRRAPGGPPAERRRSAQPQAGGQASEARPERREIAESLSEASALPRGERVDEADRAPRPRGCQDCRSGSGRAAGSRRSRQSTTWRGCSTPRARRRWFWTFGYARGWRSADEKTVAYLITRLRTPQRKVDRRSALFPAA